MDIKNQLAQVLDHEMDRKEFLARAGLLALALAGVMSVLKAFHLTGSDNRGQQAEVKPVQQSGLAQKNARSGYGSSPYGA